MSLINISNLTFGYEGNYDNIFENVSFQINTEWSLGFTGRNGRGKTTFLNLLLEKYEYTGSISRSVSFTYFPFSVNDPSLLTLRIVEEIWPNYVYWELLRELSLLEVDESVLYRQFNTLSNGEQAKVLLSTLFLKENNFLLIDEPTNHLDLCGREIVSRYLSLKKGFILVSHDRDFLDGCVDHILAINKTNIEVVQGNFSSWYYNKQLQENFEVAENYKLKKEIKRLEKTAKQKANWSHQIEKTKYGTKNSGLRADRGYVGHKSAKMMSRAKAIEERQRVAIQEKSKLLKNNEYAEDLKINQLDYDKSKLVSLDKVSIHYDQYIVCKDISFTIEQGDRIALCGKNGSGKSSLIKLICGENISFSGNIKVGSRLKISYVSQDTTFLSGDLSEFAKKCDIDESLFKAILRKLDFSRVQFDKRIENLSDGQKKKLLIAKSLCDKSHLYIWDEPLNYIDVLSRMQIEELLLKYQPTILFVEHDKAFCDKVASKTIFL